MLPVSGQASADFRMFLSSGSRCRRAANSWPLLRAWPTMPGSRVPSLTNACVSVCKRHSRSRMGWVHRSQDTGGTDLRSLLRAVRLNGISQLLLESLSKRPNEGFVIACIGDSPAHRSDVPVGAVLLGF